MEWVVQRIYSNSSLYIGRVAPKTIHLYFIAICFIYINYILLVVVFKDASLYYILNRVISLNPNPKEAILKLLILYSILAKIATGSNLILRVNTDAAFCLTFTGYLYIGKISYTNKQRSKLLFIITKVTHLDIQFSPSKDYLTFYFK
jgi:hypothetical protein